MYVCRVIRVNNKLLAGRKCDISVCAADIFKHRDYLVRGKSVFSYCGIILLTRPDYTFSRRATFSPDAFINYNRCFLVKIMFFTSLMQTLHSASSLFCSFICFLIMFYEYLGFVTFTTINYTTNRDHM